MSTLEQEGEEVVGQARCPFESRQSNVGLFAGEPGKSDKASGLKRLKMGMSDCLHPPAVRSSRLSCSDGNTTATLLSLFTTLLTRD